MTMIKRFLNSLRPLFLGRDLILSIDRNNAAADQLDAAIREMLHK